MGEGETTKSLKSRSKVIGLIHSENGILQIKQKDWNLGQGFLENMN